MAFRPKMLPKNHIAKIAKKAVVTKEQEKKQATQKVKHLIKSFRR